MASVSAGCQIDAGCVHNYLLWSRLWNFELSPAGIDEAHLSLMTVILRWVAEDFQNISVGEHFCFYRCKLVSLKPFW